MTPGCHSRMSHLAVVRFFIIIRFRRMEWNDITSALSEERIDFAEGMDEEKLPEQGSATTTR